MPKSSEFNRPPAVVLASTSRYRQTALERLGLRVECLAPGVDEESAKASRTDFAELAGHLAEAKARAVAQRRPDAVVIGGDQIAVLDGRRLDKPGDADNAARQLRALSGRTHELLTAVCVLQGAIVHRHLDITRLTMRELSAAEIERYLSADRPFDCAGSYKWEALGVALFEDIFTVDPTAVVGLPMLWLTKTLRELGIPLP
jgi:septum formation protein